MSFTAGLRLFLMTTSSSIWMGEAARGDEGRWGAAASEPFCRKKSSSSSKEIDAICSKHPSWPLLSRWDCRSRRDD